MRNTRTTDPRARGVTINLRADAATRNVIDRAAAQLGTNRSEFMLEAARREGMTILRDQRLFGLDDQTYAQFTAALDQPPTENRRLRRLLTTKVAWDK